ncbi:MAG: hypothetical protein ABSA94_13605 [Acidobacteriaceae bacterium]
MSSGKSIAALALLLALLTGCGPKQPMTAVSPAAEAPPLPPEQMVALLSLMPPPMPVIKRPLVKLDTTAPPETKVETASSQPRRPAKHHPRSTGAQEAGDAAKVAQSAPPASSQNAPSPDVQPSEMSKIGQLTSANDNSSTADRQQISSQIDATENGVNAIKRPLSSDEQKTVALIHTHITRARDALKADDLDGARNLETKARQMLEELTKP